MVHGSISPCHGLYGLQSQSTSQLITCGWRTHKCLEIILLGAIDSFEEGQCFYLDESTSKLFVKGQSSSGSSSDSQHSLLTRYFEPIGLDSNSIVVQKVLMEDHVETRDWVKVFQPIEKRRISRSSHNIPSFFDKTME